MVALILGFLGLILSVMDRCIPPDGDPTFCPRPVPPRTSSPISANGKADPPGSYRGRTGTSSQPLVPYIYAYVRAPAPTYRSPEDALSGGSPRRIFPGGYVWVSVHGRVETGGKVFYQINREEYIEASYLAFGAPSSFHGVAFSTQSPVANPPSVGSCIACTRPALRAICASSSTLIPGL